MVRLLFIHARTLRFVWKRFLSMYRLRLFHWLLAAVFNDAFETRRTHQSCLLSNFLFITACWTPIHVRIVMAW